MPTYKRQPTVVKERKFFTDRAHVPMPDLIEVQKASYDWFFKEGIKELFDEISPMTDFTGRDLELFFEEAPNTHTKYRKFVFVLFIDCPENPKLTCRYETVPFEGVVEAIWVPIDSLELYQNKETLISSKQDPTVSFPVYTAVKRRLKLAYQKFPDLFKGLI